ncbi:MAG: urea transporter permease subunit UrtB [Pseudomonadota bacterium]
MTQCLIRTLAGWITRFFLLMMLALTSAHAAPDLSPALRDLSGEDPDKRVEAVFSLSLSGHPAAAQIIEALGEDGLYVNASASEAYLTLKGQHLDLIRNQPVASIPAGIEPVMVNNALRAAIDLAKSAVALADAKPAARLLAAKQLQAAEDKVIAPVIEKSLQKETDADVKAALLIAQAALQLQFGEGAQRVAAAEMLAASDSGAIRQKLSELLRKNPDGSFVEQDAALRLAAERSLKTIQKRLDKFEIIANLFSGLSLGSILLLAALGLAITYGLMGVINMAHGEFLMIGAYVTYLTQSAFRAWFPEAFSFYVLAAIPAAFIVTALLGVVLERSVLRFLYGRPLETLLTTWGVSLLLMQTCRSIFGAQNVEVENPAWLSGGVALAGDIIIPWNRIVIVLFAIAVLAMVALLISKTRAGLYIRGVTQNRAMAACTGVATDRVDMLTFGFGSGIAGLAGVALSQIGNVGPDLGQQYIVDSFMVVVLGGVGQLSGTVIAALGLGAVSKMLEPLSGAVLAKIMVLIFIILFIQKRPQGLFAMKGRSAEA